MTANKLFAPEIPPLWTEEQLDTWTERWHQKHPEESKVAGLHYSKMLLDNAIALIEESLIEFKKEKRTNRNFILAARIIRNQDSLIDKLYHEIQIPVDRTFPPLFIVQNKESKVKAINPCINIANHLRIELKSNALNANLRAFPTEMKRLQIVGVARQYLSILTKTRKNIERFFPSPFGDGLPSVAIRRDDPDLINFKKHIQRFLFQKVISLENIETFVFANGCLYLDIEKQRLICPYDSFDLTSVQFKVIKTILEVCEVTTDKISHEKLLSQLGKSHETEKHFIKNSLYNKKNRNASFLKNAFKSVQINGKGFIKLSWTHFNRGKNEEYAQIRNHPMVVNLADCYPIF